MRTFSLACLCLGIMGLFCNGAVIAANGGRMPVDCGDPDITPKPSVGWFGFTKSCQMTEETNLNALGDMYPLTLGDGPTHYFSVGDAFMVVALLSAGFALFVSLAVHKAIVPEAVKMIGDAPSPRRW